MKKIVAALMFVGTALSAQADWGPLYITYTGYCNIKEIWVNDQGDIYGYERGCSASLGAPLFGTQDPISGSVFVSTYSDGWACMHTYRADGQLRGGCTDGRQHWYSTPIYYGVSTFLPHTAAKTVGPVVELPSIDDR